MPCRGHCVPSYPIVEYGTLTASCSSCRVCLDVLATRSTAYLGFGELLLLNLFVNSFSGYGRQVGKSRVW